MSGYERVADDAVQSCWMAYQAVGVLLSDTGQFDTPQGQKLLDNLSQARPMHDILPWASVGPVDANVEAVRAKLLERSQVGVRKYGVTTERPDLTPAEWLRHLQEELMDACVYIEAFLAKEG